MPDQVGTAAEGSLKQWRGVTASESWKKQCHPAGYPFPTRRELLDCLALKQAYFGRFFEVFARADGRGGNALKSSEEPW